MSTKLDASGRASYIEVDPGSDFWDCFGTTEPIVYDGQECAAVDYDREAGWCWLVATKPWGVS